MIDRELFLKELHSTGCCTIPDVLDATLVARARRELGRAIERERRWHGTRDYPDYGMVLCCALYDRVFIELFENERLLAPFEWLLGEGCIVYANTSSSMPPGSGNFSTRIHVDCPRLIPGYMTNMGATILLDDFTEDNGATHWLPGSHRRAHPPSAGELARGGQRLVAPAGAVWYFDARLWHAGGTNRTDRWRHSITVNMCRPYMKQRLDIPRLLSSAEVDLTGVSDRALQKLGFWSQTPASLEEYYAPPDQRKFRQPYE